MLYIHDMKSSSLIKFIKEDGWNLVRTKGSHHHFKHPNKKGIVTIPHPKKVVPIGKANSILKQAGLNNKEKRIKRQTQ